jgi:uncharacterized protein
VRGSLGESMSVNERHLSIDAVRGFAVLGILLMNIVGMGLPSFAYIDPTYAGGSTGADLWTWAVNNVLTDGKMRALFTMLFGASTVLIADRAEAGSGLSAAATHYRRMLWLLLIGVAHGVFFWFGDILVPYAIAGMIVFPFRKLSVRTQYAIGTAILILLLTKNVMSADVLAPPPGAKASEIAQFRGGFLDATQARLNMLMLFYLIIHPFDTIPEAIGQMFIGMALFRTGFFTLGWSSRAYASTVALGYLVAVPFTAWLAWRIAAANFEPRVLYGLEAWQQASRPFIALAHAAALLLVIRAGWLSVLTSRLAAAGRMAFSNYLMTSIITSLAFCGYGLGLYGHLSRFEQLGVVVAVWAAILLWSRPWLERFHYGPFEWVWRSLVQWKPQPFAKRARPAAAVV